jgi:hypothetical protein
MPSSHNDEVLTARQRREAYRSIVEGLSDQEIAERLTNGTGSPIDPESIHKLRSHKKKLQETGVTMASDSLGTGAALPFIRISTLKDLARRLDRKIDGLSGNGSSFHAESKELREALKQIAQETEGTAGQDAALSVIAEIRRALARE